jgi:large conductance mechanosensitive channel
MSRLRSIIKEFKEFAVKGNVVDLAVAVIVGGAFTPIIKSLVDDIIMPPIGLLTGGVDFKDHFIQLSQRSRIFDSLDKAKAAHAVTINYGVLVNNLITFLIVAFAVFLLVRGLNSLKRPSPNAAPVVKDCPACTMSIPIKATRCPHCTSDLGAAQL